MKPDEPGLIESLTRVGADLFGMAQSRLELASIELGEARGRLVFTLVASFAAVFLLAGSLLAISAWLALALWPVLGYAVLGWIALAYLAAAAAVLLWLRGRVKQHPPLLADTLAELRNDAAYMRGEESPSPAPRGAANH